MCRRSMIFIIQNEKILNCFPNYDINLGESFFFFSFFSLFGPTVHLTRSYFSLTQPRSPCFYFVSPTQMGNVWWISLFINIMSFHRLHNPFRLNWLQFSFRASFRSGNLPRPHIHDLDWDKRHTYSIFSPLFPLVPLALPHIYFSVWLIQPWNAPGIMASQRGPSLELFSPVQDGSALPASLRRGIEQSIKVYLSICQLQWAVWWALIGQALLCFSSRPGCYGCRRQLIKQFKTKET